MNIQNLQYNPINGNFKLAVAPAKVPFIEVSKGVSKAMVEPFIADIERLDWRNVPPVQSIIVRWKYYKLGYDVASKHICRKCGGIGKTSKAYVDAYTLPNEVGSRTILEGEGGLRNCLKCIKCGHSWR